MEEQGAGPQGLLCAPLSDPRVSGALETVANLRATPDDPWGKGETMRKAIVFLAAISLVAATAAQAAPPVVKDASVAPFVNTYWSSICGETVYMSATGSESSLLYWSGDKVVKQIENFHQSWTVFTAEKSFSYDSLYTLTSEYPGGAVVGGPAHVTFSGRNGQIPGLSADAGMKVWDSQVAGFDTDGAPQWAGAFDPRSTLISQTGNWNEQEVVDAQVCALLA